MSVMLLSVMPLTTLLLTTKQMTPHGTINAKNTHSQLHETNTAAYTLNLLNQTRHILFPNHRLLKHTSFSIYASTDLFFRTSSIASSDTRFRASSLVFAFAIASSSHTFFSAS